MRELGRAKAWACSGRRTCSTRSTPGDSVVLLHRGRVLATERAERLAGERGLAETFLALTGLEREALA